MRRFPVRRLGDCHTVDDFRELARRKLPYPVFHYIDGAADDEVTRNRNTQAYEDCDLVPNVLAGVADIDMSTTLMGRRIDMPLFLSPTALQRLFHWRGEKAVGAAAEKFGTFFGISSLATVSLAEIGESISSPKLFQLYVHKDKGLNAALIQAAKDAKFDALALTVDTIVSGKRERCLHTGFTSPPRLTPSSAISFATHPGWTLNYLGRERFSLPNLESHVAAGTEAAISVADYFNTMLDQSMDWTMAEQIRAEWGGPFCLKGVMSVEDARRAVDIGATAIMVSNHGGRQLDGSRAPVRPARRDRRCGGGPDRGDLRWRHHARHACAEGAERRGQSLFGRRLYLYALAAGGQRGVERTLANLRGEIERGMKLMGVTRLDQLGRGNLRWR